MADPVGTGRGEGSRPSPGTRAAAVVRGLGAGTADLTENLTRAGGAAVAEAVRGITRAWGDVVGMTIDGMVAATTMSMRRRRPGSRGGGERRPGARTCLDLSDVRTPEQIDEALAKGLAAAAPRRPSRAAG
jgi:hypothetical protein